MLRARLSAMFCRTALLAALFWQSGPALADCTGDNLIEALPAQHLADLRAISAEAPYGNGNLWRATRGQAVIHLMGTYHLNDPRHAATMVTLAPLISAATTVLVEAGPEEEAQLAASVARDPDLILNLNGPTLPELLSPAEWAVMKDALRDRGIAPFMAARFRIWYITIVLSIPACDMADAAAGNGLDAAIIDAALAAGIPVQALEPFDTLFGIFDDLPTDDQLSLLRSTLALEGQAADFSTTVADAYFAQEGRLIWEFMRFQALTQPGASPEAVQRDFAVMEKAMLSDRNQRWIAVLESAAARGPAFAAFGALHLSGQTGVLHLLEQRGFAITRLPLP